MKKITVGLLLSVVSVSVWAGALSGGGILSPQAEDGGTVVFQGPTTPYGSIQFQFFNHPGCVGHPLGSHLYTNTAPELNSGDVGGFKNTAVAWNALFSWVGLFPLPIKSERLQFFQQKGKVVAAKTLSGDDGFCFNIKCTPDSIGTSLYGNCVASNSPQDGILVG